MNSASSGNEMKLVLLIRDLCGIVRIKAEESENEIKIASALELIGCARMRCQEAKQCFSKDRTDISSRLLWKLEKDWF